MDGLLPPTPDVTLSEFCKQQQQPAVEPTLHDSNPLEPLDFVSSVETACQYLPLSALVAQPPNGQTAVHVLIVDDNDINLKVGSHPTDHIFPIFATHILTKKKIMAAFMRKVGCSYNTATNGQIALEKYKNSPRPYDYVLMGSSAPPSPPCFSSFPISNSNASSRHLNARHGWPRLQQPHPPTRARPQPQTHLHPGSYGRRVRHDAAAGSGGGY